MVKEQLPGQKRFDLLFGSAESGAQQARLLGPPRWMFSMVAPDALETAAAALWRKLILSLEGRVNLLAVYDLLNIEPRGTARGTWTCNGGAAAGATSIPIAAGVGQAGTTVLSGDWVGVGQGSTGPARQLLHVQADVTLNGSGQGQLTVTPPLRVALTNGAAMVWDKPTCLCRQTADETRWSSRRGRQSGFSLDLVESWEGS
ncbi:hypothetical protein [Ramlibacter sp. Leaf400]|uniref:hypothetical protein n=1 Tax=Ramlibacter sp. Leaf400 TaxID=1736365 RepID=UPI0012E3E499|nr:hypothetical protein [Ramlibacter sp. Leaf400]